MTLDQLESTLPNGLHDAELTRIIVDYERRQMSFELAVWVGDIDAPPDRREAYRNGRVDISGLLFLVIEPPDPKYPFKSSDLTIDGCDTRMNLNSELLDSVPPDAFFRSFWVNQWNAFIHVAAKDAQMSWMNEASLTYRTSKELKAKSQKPSSRNHVILAAE